MPLYIVSTPIGNIKDITLRALEVFDQTDVFLCEDTRVTRNLLKLINIETKNKQFISYFEHNERKKVSSVIDMLKAGLKIALVSDAGTPLISDPGFPLIRELRSLTGSEIQIISIPGASSVIAALTLSGFPTDKFTFLGYVPRKPADRKKMFRSAARSNQNIKATFVCFESAVRLNSTLGAMRELFTDKLEVCICRELTKKFEEVKYVNLNEYKELSYKGEIVLLFRFKY